MFVDWCEFCHYSSSTACFPSKLKEKPLELNKPWHSIRSVPYKHCHIPSLLIAGSSFSSQVAAKRICEVCRRAKPINKIPKSNPGEGKTWLSSRMEGLGRWRARQVRAGAEAVWINTGDGAKTLHLECFRP